MKFKVFAIFDSKAGAYMQPFFMANYGMAIRAFGDAVSAKDTVFSMHPEDYALCDIGSYDDGIGSLSPTVPVKSVVTGLEVRALVNNAGEKANGEVRGPLTAYEGSAVNENA